MNEKSIDQTDEKALRAEITANANKIASALATESLDISISNTSLQEMMKHAFREAITEYMKERDEQITKIQNTVDVIATQSIEHTKRLNELYHNLKLEPIPGSRSETHSRKENKQKPKSMMQRFWDWLEEEPAPKPSTKQTHNR